jgi:hypothetical protein
VSPLCATVFRPSLTARATLALGAILTPGARPVSAALRVMGLATERRFTNDYRVLNRATGSALQASRMLLGWLIMWLVPPEATLVLGADETVERRSGRQIKANGCAQSLWSSSACYHRVWMCPSTVVSWRPWPGIWSSSTW